MAESDLRSNQERASRTGRGRRPEGGAPADGRDASLRDLRQTLWEGRWVILTVLVISIAAAAGYVFITPPTYRATALLQVAPRPDGARHLEDLTALLGPHTQTGSEIELLRSRKVVGAALDRLGLEVQARPRWMPVFGQGFARRWKGDAPAPPPFGLLRLQRFAWGGEQITVRSLRVPPALLGLPLTVTALGEDRFRLSGPDGVAILDGVVGTPASVSVGGGKVELLVTALSARPFTDFEIRQLSRPALVDSVLDRLTVTERGTGTDIVSVTYEAGSPDQAAAVVKSLCTAYAEQDAERSQGETARTLAYLDGQVPKLRGELESAEATLNGYREQSGTVDLPAEARAAVDRTLELDRRIDELSITRAQTAQRYTDDYPEVKQLDQQIRTARAERDALLTRKVAMPKTQLGAARLSRSVDVAAELYLTVMKKALELQVVRSGRAGNVQIIDWPTLPYRPVRPIPAMVLSLGVLLGLFGGVAAALGRRAMDHNAEDPRDIEDGTGLQVYVTIPHSPREVSLQRSAGRGARVPLALAAPDDAATEMLRTLRTALGFVLKARGKVVSVSSPSKGVGKSFVCANLAQLLAAAGQRVLLIDADLRQGRLHRYFSADQSMGLSDVLGGAATLDEAIKSTGTAGLDLLPRGDPADSPAELLARPKLAELIATATARYDVILVDTPPILSVTDALLAARCASVNLLVLRARQHPVAEIAEALELFARSGVTVHGGILNDARPGGSYGRTYQRRMQALEPATAAG